MDIVVSWRRTMREQGLFYRDHKHRHLRQYTGEYILLQQGEVRWHSPRATCASAGASFAGDHPEEAMWLKYVDPDEAEGEHYEIYDRTLEAMRVA